MLASPLLLLARVVSVPDATTLHITSERHRWMHLFILLVCTDNASGWVFRPHRGIAPVIAFEGSIRQETGSALSGIWLIFEVLKHYAFASATVVFEVTGYEWPSS